ncbi:FAD-dependent oxidoreductase [Winogradskyella sp. PC-19]|uniref:NAD(P)/FAD-dependent oxidoreductase n=1 Tax=unclassified Winogradskyella TaxID=2615021 RepID=UPI000B3CFBE3|nr:MULTISPECIES: FAD-binding oxidoreductase [unclassified Winogradskyella]ARV10324.1 FAD-dependent oxidoreductase [Winogradskyella sp. PC-19]RZN75771.1 MAG: FAD-binding oxidoreductase [Winogradskyella sp.]
MKNVDYIIVGCGLAGIAFSEVLKSNSKSFIVYDDASQQSSMVAAGLYNPVILKRFTEVWKAKIQLDIALPSYAKIEKELGVELDYQHPIYRRFSSIEEQNLWFTASDKPSLEPFLSTEIKKNKNQYIDASFGLGEVLHGGRIDTAHLISAYKKDLKSKGLLIEEEFDYKALDISETRLSYKDIEAKHIIFAEGYGVKHNPYFNHIPLNGTKGEVLTIKAPDLKLDTAIKSSVFIISIGNDFYKVGSTYKWKDKTNTPTEAAKQELLTKLKKFITCDFEVVDHQAGIRPTVGDRRPIVGNHPKIDNLYVLNGLGSRGVMIGPYVAQKLFNLIENNIELDNEINIKRFKKI